MLPRMDHIIDIVHAIGFGNLFDAPQNISICGTRSQMLFFDFPETITLLDRIVLSRDIATTSCLGSRIVAAWSSGCGIAAWSSRCGIATGSD